MITNLRIANITVPAGNQITNTVTKTLFADAYLYPANSDSGINAGQTFRFKAFGYVSSAASGAGTLTLTIDFGSVVMGTAVMTLPTSLANAGFMLDGVVTICSRATAGKASCQGFVILDNAGAALTAAMVNAGTVATGQVAINTQTAGSVGISGKFSVADVANFVTLSSFVLEEIQ